MTTFHESLAKDHVVAVPITIPPEELQRAADLFLTFLDTVPDKEKRLVHFQSPFHRGSADGYSDKRNTKGKDRKEFFHFGPRLRWYPEYHSLYHSSREARAFFNAAEAIYLQAKQAGRMLFETEFPELAHRCVVRGDLPNAVVRFLCYTPGDSEAFTAKAHTDKSYGTLALAESASGLRVGCCREHPLKKVTHTGGTAIFMPGDLMFEDSQKKIIPTWHDVVAEKSAGPISSRCERWAIVFFIDDKDGRYPPWDEVHNPLKVHE